MLSWIVQLGYKTSDGAAPPAPSPVSQYSGGGGGGFYPLRKEARRKGRDLSTLLDESLPAVYAELAEGPKQVAAQAKAIVAPFKAEQTIDWDALERSASSVGRLLALVAKQRTATREDAKRMALQRSDEDWFLMN